MTYVLLFCHIPIFVFQTINSADIATVRRLGKPPHLIMRIMDCVLILCQKKLDPVTIDFERGCIKPSWGESLRVCILGLYSNSGTLF